MSKYSEIADTLRSEIISGVYGKDGKLPTEYELVTRFGVSRQTIRQAVSTLKNLGLVYQVQGSGTYVSVKDVQKRRKDDTSSPAIMVICTYISDYIFPSIIRGIESVLTENGARMNLAATGNKVDTERMLLGKIIEDNSVDALIVEGTKTGLPSPNISLYRKISEMGIPIVFLHSAYNELENPVVVGMDDYKGGIRAAKKLIAGGSRKPSAIFKSDDRQGLMRYAGFIEGILEEGIPLESTEIRWFTTEDVLDFGIFGRAEKVDALQMKKSDGLVCYNDDVAVTVLRTCISSGYNIPRIVSFDNSYLAAAYEKRFESLPHRKEALGRTAAEKILSMLEGNEEKSVYFDWE